MLFNLPRIAYGLLLSALIGGLAYWRGSLTRSGWLGAIITGTCTFGFGGWAWGTLLAVFFVSSSLLSRYKQALKARRTGEKFAKDGRRDLGQALANGGVASAIALLYALLGQTPVLFSAYIGVLAAVTADTWATELGVLSASPPRLITTGRPVAPGTSGGVTLFGTAIAAIGGGVIGAAALFSPVFGQWLGGQPPTPAWWLLPLGLASGLIGALTDSLLGATVQAMYTSPSGETERPSGPNGLPNTLARGWRWMNNDVVNLICSLTGGAVAVLLHRLWG